MKIGIIGTGKIGSTLARQFVRAGHEVILNSRHPDDLKTFAQELGPNASVAQTPVEAAQKGDVVLLSIPLGEVPKLSKELTPHLKNKIVMDTCNPYIDRDGQAAEDVFQKGQGSGVWVAKHFPGARFVKAFNTVFYKLLGSEAHRPGDPVGVPIASDDREAGEKVFQLVQQIGYGPYFVGDMKRAKEFDPETPPYASGASLQELKNMFQPRKKVA